MEWVILPPFWHIIYGMEYKKITLRIPTELHKTLLELAKKSSKSMNAEIINRVQSSIKDNQESKTDLAELIRSTIREELSKNNK